MALVDLVPTGVNVSKEEADTLLELAYLTTAADGRLDDDELAAFTQLVARLQGAPARGADVDALLDRFAGNVEHAEIAERVQVLAPALPAALRPVAFKLSVALGVADLDASDDESDLHALLAESLGLDAARVDELTAEVYASLDAGEEA